MTNSLKAALNKIKNDNEDKFIVSTSTSKKQSFTSRTRKGTVLIGAHVSPKIQKQLKILAAEEETQQQALILEALELLFTKYGKKVL